MLSGDLAASTPQAVLVQQVSKPGEAAVTDTDSISVREPRVTTSSAPSSRCRPLGRHLWHVKRATSEGGTAGRTVPKVTPEEPLRAAGGSAHAAEAAEPYMSSAIDIASEGESAKSSAAKRKRQPESMVPDQARRARKKKTPTKSSGESSQSQLQDEYMIYIRKTPKEIEAEFIADCQARPRSALLARRSLSSVEGYFVPREGEHHLHMHTLSHITY